MSVGQDRPKFCYMRGVLHNIVYNCKANTIHVVSSVQDFYHLFIVLQQVGCDICHSSLLRIDFDGFLIVQNIFVRVGWIMPILIINTTTLNWTLIRLFVVFF